MATCIAVNVIQKVDLISHRKIVMGKYAELKAAVDAAEAALSSVSLAESDEALKV